MKILGLDPGFANFGWCVVDYAMVNNKETELVVKHMGVITTEKDPRKVLSSIDNMRRCAQIAEQLEALCLEPRGGQGKVGQAVDCICVEAMSYPPNASAAAKMSLAWGVLATVAYMTQLPMVQASPQDIKMAVVGSKKASKAQMEATLAGRYPETLEAISDVALSRREHAYDALGAIVACLGSETIKMGVRRWNRSSIDAPGATL